MRRCLAEIERFDIVASPQFVTGHSVADAATISFSSQPSQPIFSSRVLVVEDNAVNQMVATRLLEKLDCRVDVAGNGRKAMEMTSLLPYDAIFMDCHDAGNGRF